MTAVETIKEQVEALGYTVHIDRAPEISKQYVVLSGPATGRTEQEPLNGARRDTASDLRVTAVVGTTDGVRIMLRRIRDVLSPGMQWQDFAGDAEHVSIRYERSELVGVDDSVVITNTNQHPAYGVDTYRLITEAE